MSAPLNKPRIPGRLPYSLARGRARVAACLDSTSRLLTMNASVGAVRVAFQSAAAVQTMNASAGAVRVGFQSAAQLRTTNESSAVICADD